MVKTKNAKSTNVFSGKVDIPDYTRRLISNDIELGNHVTVWKRKLDMQSNGYVLEEIAGTVTAIWANAFELSGRANPIPFWTIHDWNLSA